ncbi:MAG: Nif11 family protein [Pleurocapsa sp. CRU_1_2]|nr:Nif11 family protein [Pleurocapsa sp. CRU_1_2]
MSEQEMQKNLEQFLQMAAQDLELQSKLKAASDRNAYIISVVELGKEKGYSFTSDSVEAALNTAEKEAAENDKSVFKLSDRELASVAGASNIFRKLARELEPFRPDNTLVIACTVACGFTNGPNDCQGGITLNPQDFGCGFQGG